MNHTAGAGTSSGHANPSLWGWAATSAKALDLHAGKDEFEPARSGLRSLGEPSLHLCYKRGLLP